MWSINAWCVSQNYSRTTANQCAQAAVLSRLAARLSYPACIAPDAGPARLPRECDQQLETLISIRRLVPYICLPDIRLVTTEQQPVQRYTGPAPGSRATVLALRWRSELDCYGKHPRWARRQRCVLTATITAGRGKLVRFVVQRRSRCVERPGHGGRPDSPAADVARR